MTTEIADYIAEKVEDTLNSIYNYRKDQEGLVSAQNMLITDLKKTVCEWREKQTEDNDDGTICKD